MVGQYGAGKSMTLREVFYRLKARYLKGSTVKFPVYVNLREHSGQKDPVEILERHARGIGFDSPNSLVRAWRAGFVILLIDGFDEVTSLGVQGSWKKLKELRTRSLEGVRRLIRDSAETGIIVSGRSHYFEDYKELAAALGLKGSRVLSVDEFTETQMRQFLGKFADSNAGGTFPNWLPTRPLLLGYLASRGLLMSLSSGTDAPDAIDGWDYLLERIYEREELIETNLDGATLRRILERAASVARISEDGLGPITRSDLFAAFTEVCGYEPDDQGVLAIQRLPGLGIYRAEDESRCFVDKELAEVCNGRELFRFFQAPYAAVAEKLWVDAMNNCDRAIGDAGAELALRKLRPTNEARGLVRQAIALLNTRSDLKCVRGDIASVAMNGGIELDLSLQVSEISFFGKIVEFHSDGVSAEQISFSHCLFDTILLEADLQSNKMPYFDNCLISRLTGRMSLADLPKEKFSECEIDGFETANTADGIRSAQLSRGEKILLVTLRNFMFKVCRGEPKARSFAVWTSMSGDLSLTSSAC